MADLQSLQDLAPTEETPTGPVYVQKLDERGRPMPLESGKTRSLASGCLPARAGSLLTRRISLNISPGRSCR